MAATGDLKAYCRDLVVYILNIIYYYLNKYDATIYYFFSCHLLRLI